MSKPRKQFSYLNVDRNRLLKTSVDGVTTKELEDKVRTLLDNQIHGISFSPYLDHQDPSEKSFITQEQIADRLEIIRPYTKWIRTFSCTLGNEEVPRIAKEKSLKTVVGAWIDSDEENNELEISNAISIGKKGHADILAIGNEVLLRKDLEVEQLITYIRRVKEALPHVLVGYVDAYYMFVNYPEIVEECDVLFANCYPFWEHCPIEISVDYMKKMYDLVLKNSEGKRIIISETGWPTKGEQYGGALPSYENSMRYFVETHEWAQANNIETFYFSSFDEVWKMNHEGEYGAYWGIWDKEGNYKFNQTSKK